MVSLKAVRSQSGANPQNPLGPVALKAMRGIKWECGIITRRLPGEGAPPLTMVGLGPDDPVGLVMLIVDTEEINACGV